MANIKIIIIMPFNVTNILVARKEQKNQGHCGELYCGGGRWKSVWTLLRYNTPNVINFPANKY